MKLFKKIAISMAVSVMSFAGLTVAVPSAYADSESGYGFGVSPMKEKIILNPGETYSGSFKVTNPAKNTEDFSYVVSVSPVFVDENYNIKYEEMGDFNQIVNWIKLDKTSGTLKPNGVDDIYFKINVPNDAPAGGQYAAIVVKSNDNDTSSKSDGLHINQSMAIAHTILAELTGTSAHSGKISSINLPSFMLSGKITGSSTIENTGNVHGDATYKLQVFPLFSSEEVYTNEEDPDTNTVLPGRTFYHETTWNETPAVGIFNVIYTVEFEGVSEQISKLVIICPLWLIFIIVFIVVALVVWIIIRVKGRKKSRATAED